MREIAVERVGTDPNAPTAVAIILKERGSGSGLLLFVDSLIGRFLVQTLEQTPSPRPLTFDLLATILEKLGASVTRVEITKAAGGTFFASVILKSADKEVEIDARPSDAITLAIKTKAPIWANVALLKELPPMQGFVESWPKPVTSPTPSRPPPPGGIPEPSVADLAYAEVSPLQKLDLYLPPKDKVPAPLMIWIHGGGWRVGDKRSMPNRNFGPAPKQRGPNGPYQIQVPDVAALVSKGYAVVSLNYRLDGPQPEGVRNSVRDAKTAVRFLRDHAKEYGLDPEKFAVWGNSAGGYVAAMLGATGDQPTIFDPPASPQIPTSTAVQAVIVWYGAEDRLPGAELAISHYAAKARKLPPYLIANGDADPVISIAQARRLHDAVTQAGAKSILTVVPGAGHEDPLFMSTQMDPAFSFLDLAFGR